MNQKLTKRQREILNLTSRLAREKGMPPTLQELADNLRISAPSVLQHIEVLVKKGFLLRERGKPRSLRVIGPEEERGFVNVPVVGAITAGQPILAVHDPSGVLRLHRDMVKKNKNL